VGSRITEIGEANPLPSCQAASARDSGSAVGAVYTKTLSQDPDRPAICIGTDEFHTPEAVVQAIERICGERGVSTARNVPFAGTYVPLPFWRREPRVTSVMIEVRRDTYMEEATGARSAAFEETQALIGEILEVTIGAWTALPGVS